MGRKKVPFMSFLKIKYSKKSVAKDKNKETKSNFTPVKYSLIKTPADKRTTARTNFCLLLNCNNVVNFIEIYFFFLTLTAAVFFIFNFFFKGFAITSAGFVILNT